MISIIKQFAEWMFEVDVKDGRYDEIKNFAELSEGNRDWYLMAAAEYLHNTKSMPNEYQLALRKEIDELKREYKNVKNK